MFAFTVTCFSGWMNKIALQIRVIFHDQWKLSPQMFFSRRSYEVSPKICIFTIMPRLRRRLVMYMTYDEAGTHFVKKVFFQCGEVHKPTSAAAA
jgi:hypothetical protein